MKATVITDASFCHKSLASGWAAWIRIDGHKDAYKYYGEFKVKVKTSGEDEKLAGLNGIHLAKKIGATDILLQTDNMSVVKMVNNSGVKQSTRNKFLYLLRKIGLIDVKITARHVKGHSKTQDARSYVNRWCDKMAKDSMRQARV